MSREDAPASLWEHVDFLWSRRKFIGIAVGIASAVAVVIALFLPNSYRASATLLVSAQSTSPLDLLTGAPITAESVMSKAFSFDNSNLLYVGLLKSREVGEPIVDEFGLQERYEAEDLQQTLVALEEHTSFDFNKEDLLVISVVDTDPDLAAQMANRYVDQLLTLSQRLDKGKAGPERAFLEEKLAQVQKDLKAAEEAFRDFQENHSAVDLEAQAKAVIEVLGELKGSLLAAHVEREKILLAGTTHTGEAKMVNKSIEELERQIKKFEAKRSEHDSLIPVGQFPSLSLQYARLYREVMTQNTMLELVTQQLAFARIREERQARPVQVIDHARVPTQKFKPNRKMIVVATAFVSGVISLLIAYFLEGWQRHQRGRRREKAPRKPLGRTVLDGLRMQESEHGEDYYVLSSEDPDCIRDEARSGQTGAGVSGPEPEK